MDLSVVSLMRVIMSFITILRSKDKHNKNPDESVEEKEVFSLKQSLIQYIRRKAFPTELLCLCSMLLILSKALIRFSYELQLKQSDASTNNNHASFWIILAISFTFSLITHHTLHPAMNTCKEKAIQKKNSDDLEQGIHMSSSIPKRKAGWWDLVHICLPDWHLIVVACIFLILAALTQVFIPKITGHLLDAISKEYHNTNNATTPTTYHVDDSSFKSNIQKLLALAICGGICAGIRGSIFTLVSKISYIISFPSLEFCSFPSQL